MLVQQFPLPSLEAQVDLVERHGIDTLLYCRHAWALRHSYINQETGEVIRARCNRWDCLFCGPRKVDLWRQLIKAAEPTLFLTLSKAGRTVEEAARALTTFMQYLRRGSKGRGKKRVGARLAYPVEYFGVLERHSNFQENGFHWHLLLKGVDFIPYEEVIKPGWWSATHGRADIGWIEAIRRPQVIGYVTKYLMKAISNSERGTKLVSRKRRGVALDVSGRLVADEWIEEVVEVSRARRIRYSRNFYPERVADLRARLFSENEEQEMMEGGENGLPLEDGESGEQRKSSSWRLFEQEEPTEDRDEQARRRRKALTEAVEDIREGRRELSRRVIGLWAYQRGQSRKGKNE